MEGQKVHCKGILETIMEKVSGGLSSDRIIKVLDCHTKELGHYSVDNGKPLKGLWR